MTQRVSQRQVPFDEWIRGIPPYGRAFLGWTGSALLAFYLPMCLVAAFGIWVNNLTNFAFAGITLGMILAEGLVAWGMRRIWVVGIVCAIAIFGYEADLIARVSRWDQFSKWGLPLFAPPAFFLLNSFFLSRFRKLAGFEKAKRANSA